MAFTTLNLNLNSNSFSRKVFITNFSVQNLRVKKSEATKLHAGKSMYIFLIQEGFLINSLNEFFDLMRGKND